MMTTGGAEARFTPAILAAALGAALGGLLFGFDTAVISGTTQTLQRSFALSDAALGFTVAAALIGTVIGALTIGAPTDRYGRKPMLQLIAIVYLISSLGCALAPEWYSLVVARFMGGLAIGAASVVTPIYIAEVAPAASRGRLVALNQLNIVVGILVAFVSNYVVARSVGGDASWRWMLGLVAIPSVLFVIVSFALPRSPRWLVQNGRVDEALAVMARLGFDDPRAAIADMQRAATRDAQNAGARLFERAHLTPVLCAVGIAMFNQLSGINALMYYAPRIFELAGAGAENALLQSVAVGGTNLVFTLAAFAFIDRFGRKPLMYFGSVGCAIALFVVAIQLSSAKPDGTLVLAGLLGFIACFAISQGAVIWVFISEVFPSAVRGKGQALGSSTHWVMAAAITWLFPLVARDLGGWVFAFFGAMMLVQGLWVWRFMPETRGIPLEEMDLG